MAIDFETATASRDSACAIGIAQVHNLAVTGSFYSLIKPPGCAFSEKNISLHGIRPRDVRSAPAMAELWPSIRHYFSDCPVLAHNASFDMSVLKNSMGDAAGLVEDFEYIDTISIARRFVSGRLSLDACAKNLGVRLENHHNAKEDAIACAQIAVRCMEFAGVNRLSEFCKDLGINTFRFASVRLSGASGNFGKRYPETIRISDIRQSCGNLDCTHPLYGKRVTFTGLLSFARREAMQLAINVGAVVLSSVSSKTDYLVVGTQDLSLVGSDGISGKEKRAAQLNAEGKSAIQIIGEHEFMHLLRNEDVLV